MLRRNLLQVLVGLPLLPWLVGGRRPKTDFMYVSVYDNSLPPHEYVFAYCNGKKVEMAQEADVRKGFVRRRLWDERACGHFLEEILYGEIQILFVNDDMRREYLSKFGRRALA